MIIIGKLTNEIFEKLKKNKLNYENYISASKNKLVNEYKKSDLLLYPSNYEGFGIPIIEAQSIGRAVITSNLEPMITVAGKGALFVNPKNIKEISKSVKLIIKNQKLRNLLIDKGFQNIKRFKKETILNKHLIIYKNVINCT